MYNNKWSVALSVTPFLTFGCKILMIKYDEIPQIDEKLIFKCIFTIDISFYPFNFHVVLCLRIKYLCEAINFLFLCCCVLFMYFIARTVCTDTNEHNSNKISFQFRVIVSRIQAVARSFWAHTFTMYAIATVWQCRQQKIDYWLNINNLRVFVASLLLCRFHCKISSAHRANGGLYISSSQAILERTIASHR